jgi:FkbM family methyltransferase
MNLYGYYPTVTRKLLAAFARRFSCFFWLDKPTIFSAEVLQCSKPYYIVKLSKFQSLKFLTNHARLLWRAKTLLTEEPLMLDWIKSFSASSLYLDIGANVGSYVLLSKAYHPNIKIYAAELDFNNLYLLYHNLVANNMHHNVLLLPFALIDKQRTCIVNYRDLSQGDALQSVDRATPFETKKTKQAHRFAHLGSSLDDLLRYYSLEQPSHIKIDVDGNERLLLLGAKNTLSKADSIYFENSLSQDCIDFANFLIESGFHLTKYEKIYSKNLTQKLIAINQVYIR